MNYYNLLNIDRKASQSEIQKSYFNLSKQFHPDKGGDPDKFKQISEAYHVLSNKRKRSKYDKYGTLDIEETIDPYAIFGEFEHLCPSYIFDNYENQMDIFQGLDSSPAHFFNDKVNHTIITDNGDIISKITINGSKIQQMNIIDKHPFKSLYNIV